MNSKKILALLCALILVVSLFAGCAPADKPDTNVPDNTPAVDNTGAPDGAGDVEPAVETIHYAKGKYETDEAGWPLAYYEYETPICEEDITLTYWTACYTPEYLPEEGFAGADFHQKEAELTGVNIEFIVPAWASRGENYSVLRASDDLPDMLAQVGLYISGSKMEAISDGGFANIYDYKEYCPNYMYYIASHMEEEFAVYTSIFLDSTTIFDFKGVYDVALPSDALMGIRRDWIRDLGMDTTDIVTVEDFHQLLLAFQSQMGCEHPLYMNNSVDVSKWFACYDTYTWLDNVNAALYPNPCVINGEVRFCYSDDNAKAFVEMMSGWIAEGLVSPDWMGDAVGIYWDDCFSGDVATTALVPQTITALNAGTQANDPDADWWYLPKSVLYEGQVLHLGNSASYTNNYNAGTAISAKCENIPLAVTWCDWRYSELGADMSSFGLEGTVWEYDESGDRIVTAEIAENSWLGMIYAGNFQVEHGLKFVESQYNNAPGYADVCLSIYKDFQNYAYDGAYEWPKGAILSEDQSEEYFPYSTDLSTFVQENILLFLNGDVPLTEWDAYIGTLKTIGLEEAQAIYQEAYDDYMAKYA